MAVWDSLVFILNGLIFILIGLQLDTIVRGGLGPTRTGHPVSTVPTGLEGGDVAVGFKHLLVGALVISVVAIVGRVIWVFPMAYLPRLIPAVRRRDPKPEWKSVAIVSWAGMRGIVTLAAAYALDEDVVSDRPKQVILFISFVVVLITLVVQGFTLAPLIRFLGIRGDYQQDQREEVEARLDAAHAAVSRLTVLSFDDSISPDVINRVRAEYDERIARLGGKPKDQINTELLRPDEQLNRIRREALIAERKMITFMRDQNIVGDEVLRRILVEIDLEEAKLLSNA
jgi:CPA1 family monovalent cation:H+ antiporter